MNQSITKKTAFHILILCLVIFLIITGVKLVREHFSKTLTVQNHDPIIRVTDKPKIVPSPTATLPLHTIGQVTRHANRFAGQNVKVAGYLIKKEAGYLIFSDETVGAISSFDLPVIGAGIDIVKSGQKYTLEGAFIYGGLKSSNKNLYHLELSNIPQAAPLN